MDDYERWRADKYRRECRRQRETAHYDEPIRDEWVIALELCMPFLWAVIVVALILAALYVMTP